MCVWGKQLSLWNSAHRYIWEQEAHSFFQSAFWYIYLHTIFSAGQSKHYHPILKHYFFVYSPGIFSYVYIFICTNVTLISFKVIEPELQIRCVKLTSFNSTCVIPSPNPMFDLLLLFISYKFVRGFLVVIFFITCYF